MDKEVYVMLCEYYIENGALEEGKSAAVKEISCLKKINQTSYLCDRPQENEYETCSPSIESFSCIKFTCFF
ncbi:hypothetical protein HNY73_007376 [Argiope bruennichi]|uniref:Uncharacterized protein n=1 Tax=Argiope bruennichi TaxID=94029 RepID=A0A8T0FGT1_ARGBR|nr:hypothetical protein HNY73_007376 [Argiope bruennichi]